MAMIHYPVANKNDIDQALLELDQGLITLSDESTMPHKVTDVTNNKTYKMGLQIKDGKTQIMYEEVV